MRADNSHHIVTAARRRATATRRRAVAALRRMDNAGQAISFDAVAREGQVSRSWLYSQPDLRAEIERLRARRDPAPVGPRLPDRQRASDASLATETRGRDRTKPPARSREPTATRGACGRPRRTARDLDHRPPRRHAEKEISTSHRTLLTAASATLATKHRRRSTQQATTGLKITSGLFAANCAWLACAVIAHNLLRAAGTIAGGDHAVARGATLRRDLVTVPARFAAPARKPTLHLPAHWPWQTGWKTLWDTITGYSPATPRAG